MRNSVTESRPGDKIVIALHAGGPTIGALGPPGVN
jgi:hypothetical protein